VSAILDSFEEIWMVDFEFNQTAEGDNPLPVCMVAQEYHTGRTIRVWQDQLLAMLVPPFRIDLGVLFVAYFAGAELSCFKVLGWALPVCIIDLYPEFRNETNGKKLPSGRGLIGALIYHGYKSIDKIEKEEMRNLVLRGGPWTPEEQVAILDYCETDVVALKHLLDCMADKFTVYSLIRGNYLKAIAHMEYAGIPVDIEIYGKLKKHWATLQNDLIEETNKKYGVYEDGAFKMALFQKYLADNNIAWPMLESYNSKGQLVVTPDTKDDTFKTMCRAYPQLNQLKELRSTLSQLKLFSLQIGRDGRNRTLLSPFRSLTGRNQPSNTKYIFGPAVWMRGLIKPQHGRAIAYIDWSQQEFGIAAALSGDDKMKEAYTSGDPYLSFAIQAGAVPTDATKESHAQERDLYKATVLATQYGMGHDSLAVRIGKHKYEAKELLRLHRETYRTYWTWLDGVTNYASFYGFLYTTYGWYIYKTSDTKERTIQNFLMQANGAEMLRLAATMMVQKGINIIAPIHDAVLVEDSIDRIDNTVQMAQEIMSDASAIILAGFRLSSEAKIVRYPERYQDKRGEDMWNLVMELLERYS
jgi:DNA polymerase I